MTVSGLELCQTSTTSIASHHIFYPAQIAVHHHQLRHFISTSEQDRIYYVNDYDIFVLNLKTRQTSLLATIPFEARCLAADHGWVCVGGEQNGDCAFIHIEQDEETPRCFGHDLSVDVLGGEIVNSMNIHLMRSEAGAEPEPIVLISNNDKTVKLYSLAQRQVLSTLKHETPMNYATMSPDSKIIAAVGDSDLVHFYKRSRSKRSDETSNGSSRYAEYHWQPIATPVVPTGDDVYDDYSFAVAFSPSGQMCAASAQGGSISVFDMRIIQDEESVPEEAILCTFRASRPTLVGCVRAMAFSPEPWDLLAWAEDHGRVGIADLRQMFLRRQFLDLDKEASEVVTLEDKTPNQYRNLGVKDKLKQQHLARLRSMRGQALRESREEQSPEDSNATASERRNTRQTFSYHEGLDLDARERSVIEALETTIDDVEHLAQPYSLNYTSSPRFRPSSEIAENEDVRSSSNVPRTGPRYHQPQRRTSVILSEPTAHRHLAPADGPRARISASPGRMTDDEDIPTTSTNDLTPTARESTSQPLPYNIPVSDPWHVIQSALETARQTDGNSGSSTDRPATLAEIEAELEAERRLGSQLERQLADERQLSTLLRRQLESQERLLQSHERELQAEREVGGRLNLQRDLETEQQHGEQRSHELETEIRLGSNMARHLESQRARLMNAIQSGGHQNSSDSSAHTTTLPTTNIRHTQPEGLAATLQRHEAFRRQRLARIENLEREVRQAESRVASANSQIQDLAGSIQRGEISDRQARLNEARARVAASARTTADTLERSGSVRTRAAVRRAELSMNADRSGTSRQSELSGRATEAEMRIARMMFLTGPRALDNNGNWIAGAALQRVLGRTSGTGDGNSTSDLVREVGLGTTGVGWSPDGRALYAGSEEGIFEFKINMRDRMTFPGIEMR